MRVLVCGGTEFYNEQWLKEELCDLLWRRGRFKDIPEGFITIIEGGARGVDTMAGQFALGAGLELEVFYADWRRYGRAAGPIRNTQMLKEGKPDLVVAFPGDRGTANMMTQARKAGVPVIEVTRGP